MVSGTHAIPISDMGFFWEAGVDLTTSTAHDNQIKWLVFFYNNRDDSIYIDVSPA